MWRAMSAIVVSTSAFTDRRVHTQNTAAKQRVGPNVMHPAVPDAQKSSEKPKGSGTKSQTPAVWVCACIVFIRGLFTEGGRERRRRGCATARPNFQVCA